jgi:glyoxylase-like metal-dependent hydrolase (beta-lactamase superfamily II)
MTPLDILPDTPESLASRALGDGVTVLPSLLPVPGLGALAVNAFLLQGDEPLLVDTGLAPLGTDFMQTLRSHIDPEALRWIWISHLDPDHVGNLAAVLECAPHAEVLTSFLGQGKMALAGLPAERVRLIEANVPVRLGGRALVPFRPPYYDAPETLGFFDECSGSLFVGDAFGAVVRRRAETAEAIPDSELREGMATWGALDAPWLGQLQRPALQASLRALRQWRTARVLSAHLPPARDIGPLCDLVEDLHAHIGANIGRAAA